jgi:trypsin
MMARLMQSVCLLLSFALADPALAARSLAVNETKGDIGAAVVGGEPAPLDRSRYPYIVSLRTPDGFHYCAGSLIRPNVVITAAHCVDSNNPAIRNPSVWAGRYFLEGNPPPGKIRRAVSTVIFPDYVPRTSDNDIAILRLDAPVTGIAATARLPRGKGTPLVSQKLLLSKEHRNALLFPRNDEKYDYCN